MFLEISHTFLQNYWWVIISLLAGILVFLMFVQGGQTMIYTLGKNETERKIIVNSLGRKWEFTFTTLVTFGGAFFASFPLFYSTSFGGAYWVWMLILFAFIIQAVSYEFRTKPGNLLGKRTFEFFLFLNGLLGTVLIGAAVATFFTGSLFSVNEFNFSKWEGPAHGLEAALNIHNLSLGLTVFFLARVLALLYFMSNIDDENIIGRVKKQLITNGIPFVAFFLIFAVWLMVRDGFAVNPDTAVVSMESFKYLHNLLQMPIVLILFLLGVVAVLWSIGGPLLNYEKHNKRAIWFGGLGTVFVVMSLFMLAGFNNTSFYPSTFE
jgi:cytochrome d ubiquinol oxidase subunit II